jgi:hypothetical protein
LTNVKVGGGDGLDLQLSEWPISENWATRNPAGRAGIFQETGATTITYRRESATMRKGRFQPEVKTQHKIDILLDLGTKWLHSFVSAHLNLKAAGSKSGQPPKDACHLYPWLCHRNSKEVRPKVVAFLFKTKL